MSELPTEQRPLLCDELSEEEHFPEFPRRYRPIYRGRAKSSAKGATAIITRWPEHWSSSLTYWWLGLGMMALTVFVIYNSVIAFALLPTAHMQPVKAQALGKPDATSYLPEIFMHFIINTDEEADCNKYLPHIEVIADRNLDYNFNLILLFNDTAHEAISHSAEENNEIALNSLWSEEHFSKQKLSSRKNIKIRQLQLSQFMNESPIKKDWRHVSPHFTVLLVKAISIWEKGGIAVNPEILTPYTPNVLYTEKFQHILNKFKKQRENMPIEPKFKKYVNKHKDKFKKKVNNIRDIINILEHEDNMKVYSNNVDSQENLTAAESVNIPVVSQNKFYSTALQASKNKSKLSLPTIIELPRIPLLSSLNDTESLDHKQYHLSNIKPHDEMDSLEVVNEGFEILDDNSETKLSLLPFFLEFLFHDKQIVNAPKTKLEETENLTRHRKSVIAKEKSKKNASVSLPSYNETKPIAKYKPIIISGKGIVPDQLLKANNAKNIDTSQEINPDELTIDLKGNILATKTSCHAFIGTVFSDVVRHSPEETLQDFVIAELSLFCKGLLSSCRGIDVILV